MNVAFYRGFGQKSLSAFLNINKRCFSCVPATSFFSPRKKKSSLAVNIKRPYHNRSGSGPHWNIFSQHGLPYQESIGFLETPTNKTYPTGQLFIHKNGSCKGVIIRSAPFFVKGVEGNLVQTYNYLAYMEPKLEEELEEPEEREKKIELLKNEKKEGLEFNFPDRELTEQEKKLIPQFQLLRHHEIIPYLEKRDFFLTMPHIWRSNLVSEFSSECSILVHKGLLNMPCVGFCVLFNAEMDQGDILGNDLFLDPKKLPAQKQFPVYVYGHFNTVHKLKWSQHSQYPSQISNENKNEDNKTGIDEYLEVEGFKIEVNEDNHFKIGFTGLKKLAF